MTASTLATISVTDALVSALRDQILNGERAPGTPVLEVEVARAFGVSRPTAKSAIYSLVLAGLLRQDAHHPAYVPRLRAEDIDDLFYVRVPVEIAVVERLCGRQDRVLAAAGQAITDLSKLPDSAPTSTFVAADLGFHLALAAAAGSPRLRRVYEALTGEIHLGMIQTRTALGRDRIAREHAQILDAITGGNTARSLTLTRQHLAGAHSALSAAARD